MDTEPRDRATALVASITAADAHAGQADELLPLVYDELRRLARHYLSGERPGHTLQATALVHEAYARLVDSDRVDWQGRTHFFAVSARAMRRVLIDHARRRDSGKRGGEWQRVTLGHDVDRAGFEPEDLLTIDAALTRLATLDPRQARIVELRFFAGLSMGEIAELLGVSKRTIEGQWTHARAWLNRELLQAGAG